MPPMIGTGCSPMMWPSWRGGRLSVPLGMGATQLYVADDPDIALRASTYVTGMPNQGSAGGNMAQTTEGLQPELSTFGGHDSVLFDGSDDMLTYDGAKGDWKALHDGTGATLFMVVRPVALPITPDRAHILTTGPTSFTLPGLEFKTWDVGGVGAGQVNAMSDVVGANFLWSMSFAAGTLANSTATRVIITFEDIAAVCSAFMYANNVQVATTTTYLASKTPSSNDPNYACNIGKQLSLYPFDGHIPVVGMIPSVLSTADRGRLDAWLQGYD